MSKKEQYSDPAFIEKPVDEKGRKRSEQRELDVKNIPMARMKYVRSDYTNYPGGQMRGQYLDWLNSGGADEDIYSRFRKILVSPTINTPDYFKGYGGHNGWPCVLCLRNGDIIVTFCAGYDHPSWKTPLDLHKSVEDEVRKRDEEGAVFGAWVLDWDCPTGGRIMFIKSSDAGKTWTKPKAFPEVEGKPDCGYYISSMTQLSDGSIIAASRSERGYGYWSNTPANPYLYSKAIIERSFEYPSQIILFRSVDNGDTWHLYNRVNFPYFLSNDAPYSIFESENGELQMMVSGNPQPGGKGWIMSTGRQYPQCLMYFMSSADKGITWEMRAVIGDEEFDFDEGTGAYLPDGSIGMATRPTSAWFKSYDGGRSWSKPVRLQNGESMGIEGSNLIYKKGDCIVTRDGIVLVVFTNAKEMGLAIYSRDSGESWILPEAGTGFQFDPISYYPSVCELKDGSLFAVGLCEVNAKEYISVFGENRFGPRTGVVSSMKFRIKKPEEGEGIELLDI